MNTETELDELTNTEQCLMERIKVLPVYLVNSQLPTPRCPHCNYRFGRTFLEMLESEKTPEEYLKDFTELHYCDKMTLFNDWAVYQRYCKKYENNKKQEHEHK